MTDTYRKISKLLNARERRHALLLFVMILVMGLLEAVGVASIMPFMGVLSNPDVVHTNPYLSALYELLGFESIHAFLTFLAAAVFFLVVGSMAFKALTTWALLRFTYMRNFSLSQRLLKAYLNQPYSWFLNRHSADLGKTVLSEVQQVITGVLIPAMQLVGHAMVALFLIVLIVAVDPVIATAAATVLGGTYAGIYWFTRKYLSRIGEDRVRANRERFQIAQEALGGIKDVKVLGLERNYMHSFSGPASRFARRQASNAIIGQIPRFVLEGIGFGGMLVIVLVFLARRDGGLASALPMIALYAFASYRLMPALQQVYQNLTTLRFGKPALDALYRDLMDTDLGSATYRVPPPPPEPLHLRAGLELRDVYYTYPNAPRPAFNGVSLTIEANTTVGLVGSTGAGKTTAVDLILGLLTPQQGELLVDGTQINEANIRAWQQAIGYVSQHIFLADATVAANIAFGIPPQKIDMEAVEHAARVAELHQFVLQNLPDGYQTMVGERGVRLSGGQRQRIGIARALYHDPDVLILDEATSALDNLTERAVMDAVHNLGTRKTIILIAHRLSTVRTCDTIFMLERGRLVHSGNYDQLIASSQSFKAMAEIGSRT